MRDSTLFWIMVVAVVAYTAGAAALIGQMLGGAL